MGRTFLDIDMARAADLLGMERRQADALPRPRARAVHGTGPGALAPSAGAAHRSNGDNAAQCDPAIDAAAGSDTGGRSRHCAGSPAARDDPAAAPPVVAGPARPAHGGEIRRP